MNPRNRLVPRLSFVISLLYEVQRPKRSVPASQNYANSIRREARALDALTVI